MAKPAIIVSRDAILITGGLGFIGGHFVDLVLKKGFNVVNIDKVTYASNPDLNGYFSKKYPGRYRFIKKDINDIKALPYCKYLVHFAAESHVDNSIRDSDIFVKSNILGTKNLLDLIVKSRHNNFAHDWKVNVPEFIYISTDEVFGDREKGHFKEFDRYNPSNPYSASKAGAEMLVMAYGRTYGIPYKITRTTNNYGSRQHPEKLVSACIMSVLQSQKIKIHGAGTQVRNWIHVEDNCRAIYDVMIKGVLNESYNISSDEEFSVNDIAGMVLNHFSIPFTIETVEYTQDRSGQDLRYALDCSKIKKLGWNAKLTFTSSLPKIARHYQRNIKKYKDVPKPYLG